MRRTCCSLDCVDTEEGAVILRMRSAKPEWQKSQAIFIRNFFLEKENKDETTRRRSLDDTDTYILRQKYLRSYQFTRADDEDERRGGGGLGGGGGNNNNMVRAAKKIVRSLVARPSNEKEMERVGGNGSVNGDIKLKVSLGTCFKLFLLSCVT